MYFVRLKHPCTTLTDILERTLEAANHVLCYFVTVQQPISSTSTILK